MAAAGLSPLPRYQGPDQAVRAWSEQICTQIEIWARALLAPAGETWTVNGTALQRDIDPAVLTTLPDVVDALGTLAHDLSKGAPLSVT